MKTIRRKTGIGWEALFLGFSKDPRRRNKKRSEAQAELAKIEDELKQALLQDGQKV